MNTLDSLLKDNANPAQPFLTYYDPATGERIELSAVTTANWVAKTSNFLIDGLDAERGTRIRLDLPTHWESFVWILSAWSVGAVLTDHDADIAVVGPSLQADEQTRVALSLKPLGMRFDNAPPGFIDYNAEVLGHSDHFQSFDPPTADSVALDLDAQTQTHQDAYDSAGANPERVLLVPGSLARDSAALIAASRGNGSLVIVANASTVQRDKIAVDERARPL